jgi:hypothetical protein
MMGAKNELMGKGQPKRRAGTILRLSRINLSIRPRTYTMLG